MLGDDVPWLVPLLAISLIAWPMAATIEKMSIEKGKWIKSMHNFLPVFDRRMTAYSESTGEQRRLMNHSVVLNMDFRNLHWG